MPSAPPLSYNPTYVEILEHFAYKASPLNDGSKLFDPVRPFFDYSIALNIPEIQKDLSEGRFSKYFPVNNSHPYLEMFFDTPLKVNEYDQKKAFAIDKKEIIQRKPLRIEAIIKIQKTLSVRTRSKPLFTQSKKILEDFISKNKKGFLDEEIDILDDEYHHFAELCRDPNYLLKKDALESKLGEETFKRLRNYKEFNSKSKFI